MPTYISKQGLEDLRAELQERKSIARRDLAEEIALAKELGDLSENFEYQDAKERQALNEARVVQLEAMIHDAVIINESSGSDQITLGTTFVAEVNGSEKKFTMVGSTEADPLSGKISNESPIGGAFMGAKTGDVVEVHVPSGTIRYTIMHIQ